MLIVAKKCLNIYRRIHDISFRMAVAAGCLPSLLLSLYIFIRKH